MKTLHKKPTATAVAIGVLLVFSKSFYMELVLIKESKKSSSKWNSTPKHIQLVCESEQNRSDKSAQNQ